MNLKRRSTLIGFKLDILNPKSNLIEMRIKHSNSTGSGMGQDNRLITIRVCNEVSCIWDLRRYNLNTISCEISNLVNCDFDEAT